MLHYIERCLKTLEKESKQATFEFSNEKKEARERLWNEIAV